MNNNNNNKHRIFPVIHNKTSFYERKHFTYFNGLDIPETVIATSIAGFPQNHIIAFKDAFDGYY